MGRLGRGKLLSLPVSHRLILLRHAKSSWKQSNLSDHQRPLNKRGLRDSPRIGQRLMDLNWQPDVVLSSDSVRTRQTHEQLGQLVEDAPVHFLAELYHGGADELCEALCQLDDQIQTVMAIGHNPGWEEAAEHLTGCSSEITTCNAVLMTTSVNSWRQSMAKPGHWSLVEILRPKEL